MIDARTRWRPIRRQLLTAMLIVACVPLFLIMAFYAYHEYLALKRLTQDLQEEVLERIAGDLLGFFDEVDAALRIPEDFHELEALDTAGRNAMLSRALSYEQAFDSLGFMDANDRLQVFVSRVRVKPPDHFIDPFNPAGADSARPIHFDQESGEPLLRMTRVVRTRRDERVVGTLIADVRMKLAWELFRGAKLGPDVDAYLLDRTGRVVAHGDSTFVLKRTSLSLAPSGETVTGLRGNTVSQVHRTIVFDGNPMTVVVEHDADAVLEPVVRSLGVAVALVVAAVLLAFGLAFVAGRTIERPIRELSATAMRIRDGDLSARAAVAARNEIGELASTFNEMSQRLQDEIAERREAERAALESAARFEDFADSAADWFWEMGPDLRFTYFSPRVEQVTGVPVEFHIGKTRAELAGEAVNTEKWRRHLAQLDAGQPFKDFRFDRKGPDGQVQHLTTSGTPIFDDDGSFSGYRGTGSDRSVEHKATQALREAKEEAENAAAELREAQAQLIRQERLSALGRVTGSVAHDLRNPLGALIATIETIDRLLQDRRTPQIERSMARARRTLDRCNRIVSTLLDASRMPELEPTRIDVDRWLAQLLDDYQTSPELVLDRDLRAKAACDIDRGLMHRAVLNLLDNACQAVLEHLHEDQGKRTMGVTLRSESDEDEISISIVDTGPGIPADDLPRLFEPLFTTKAEGVGLGLHVVKQTVEQHGGRIDIESTPGSGTTMTIRLPRASTVAPATAP